MRSLFSLRSACGSRRFHQLKLLSETEAVGSARKPDRMERQRGDAGSVLAEIPRSVCLWVFSVRCFPISAGLLSSEVTVTRLKHGNVFPDLFPFPSQSFFKSYLESLLCHFYFPVHQYLLFAVPDSVPVFSLRAKSFHAECIDDKVGKF